MKSDVFICKCYSPEHSFIFMYDEDDNELYFEVHLSNYLPFYKRVIQGFRYMFGYKSKYGNFDSVIIKPEDADKLINYLKKLRLNN